MNFLNPRYADTKNTFGPRVRFNWGYHDACNDIKNNNPHQLSDTIHDVKHVSPSFDVMYFAGYKAGLAETSYTNNSNPVWEAYRDSLTETQLKEIFEAEVNAHQAIFKKKDRNHQTLAQGRKYATEICARSF